MNSQASPWSRRQFLAAGAAGAAASLTPAITHAADAGTAAAGAAPGGASGGAILPPPGRRLLLACKLGMIDREIEGRKLSLAGRLRLAGEAGFDGVDLDQAGEFTTAEARDAVRESGVFVHNAINHAHWSQRLTSAKPAERERGRENIAHCLRVSHAAGGSGALVVIGSGSDGPEEVIAERARGEIRALLPLAASIGQPILVENVWNRMFYRHDDPPEQGPEAFIRFVDSFRSPWVGMYYDLGNHWKYGQPGDWIRAFGHRCVKLDVKGFSRKTNKFVDITSEDDDLPWADVRKALDEVGYAGWATAEVGGGGLTRLTRVREQMQKAFGL